MDFSPLPINYLAVLAAAAVSMVIGFLWYGPLFGNAWVKEMGWSKKDMDEVKKKGMAKSYGLMMLGSLLMSYVLAHSTLFATSYLNLYGPSAGMMSGFYNWLGYVVPITLSSVLWEGKSWKLWLLNVGYYLVTLMAMGALLAFWQ